MTNKMKMKGWLMVRSDLYGPFNSLLRTFIIFAPPPDWSVLQHPLIVSFIYLFILVNLFIAVFKACERQWSHEHLGSFRQTWEANDNIGVYCHEQYSQLKLLICTVCLSPQKSEWEQYSTESGQGWRDKWLSWKSLIFNFGQLFCSLWPP